MRGGGRRSCARYRRQLTRKEAAIWGTTPFSVKEKPCGTKRKRFFRREERYSDSNASRKAFFQPPRKPLETPALREFVSGKARQQRLSFLLLLFHKPVGLAKAARMALLEGPGAYPLPYDKSRTRRWTDGDTGQSLCPWKIGQHFSFCLIWLVNSRVQDELGFCCFDINEMSWGSFSLFIAVYFCAVGL